MPIQKINDLKGAKGAQLSKKVFVVHGRNEVLKLKVAKLVTDLKLTPVILHEQPDKGQTVVEKFEGNAKGIGFAIVLLTADDVGGIAGTPLDEMKYRARQNVMLELGYFMGHLGRHNVCALYEDGVELPTDYVGVLYVPIDKADAWRFKVASEMKAGGMPVNMNLLG